MEKCVSCGVLLKDRPIYYCDKKDHWQIYASSLEEKLNMYDNDRDRLDVAQWLELYEKVRSYDCHGCGRHYEIPTHLDHFTCICGYRCRLRHLGGVNSFEAVIDAARDYFGNERIANLSHIAEIVVSEHYTSYSVDDIRKIIRQEMNNWILEDDGWKKK